MLRRRRLVGCGVARESAQQHAKRPQVGTLRRRRRAAHDGVAPAAPAAVDVRVVLAVVMLALDVVVVSTAWAPYIIPGVGNYSAIRAVRVLRALRTVNRVPELRKIILTLLSSIPQVRP